MNQGIIGHANDATSQYKIAEEKEKIALGYQNYKMDKIANPNATLTVDTATVEGSEAEGGWTITFNETGNVYELDTKGNITQKVDPSQDEIEKIRAGYNKYQADKANGSILNQTDLSLLERYALGEDKAGQKYDTVLNLETSPFKFKNTEVIADAESTLTYINYEPDYKIDIYFTYKGNHYRLVSGYENDSYPTKAVEFVSSGAESESTNQADLELLERYALGENKEGKDLVQDILNTETDPMKFKNNDVINNAEDVLNYENMGQISNLNFYFTYNEKQYKLILDQEELLTKAVEFNPGGNAVFTVEGATVTGNDQDGWTVRFVNTKHKYKVSIDGEITQEEYESDIDLLKLYFLGKNNRHLYYAKYGRSFQDDPNSIVDASNSIKYLNQMQNNKETYYYIKYNNIAYKVTEMNDDGIAQNIEKAYEHTGTEGRKVQYSADGTNNKTDWVVLYDNGDTVDIVSVDAMYKKDENYFLRLGNGDTGEFSQEDESAPREIVSYNNAFETITKYCKDLISNPTAQKVRSVGSNPDFSNNDTSNRYSSESLETYAEGKYNSVGKAGDINAEQDIIRMSFYTPDDSAESSYAEARSADRYWLASRDVYEDRQQVDFCVRIVNGGYVTRDTESYLWYVNSSEEKYYYYVRGDYAWINYREATVRPVVRVNKSDVGL